MSRTLLLRRGALGDTLLCVPLLRALRAERPGAAVDCAGNGDFVPLLARFGVADETLSSECLQLRTAGDRRAAAADVLARYDWIVSDVAIPPHACGARVDVFDPRVDEDAARPAWQQLVDRVFGRGRAPPGGCEPPWLLQSRRPTRAELVVLHPGSGSLRKCWPRGRWEELARLLEQRGAVVEVVLGPAELERAPPWRGPGTECRPDDVLELAARLEPAAAFAGHDSGVTHLAAALRVPTVAIFGPTDPRTWSPGGSHVRVVGRPTMEPPDAPVAEVLAAIEAALDERRRGLHPAPRAED